MIHFNGIFILTAYSCLEVRESRSFSSYISFYVHLFRERFFGTQLCDIKDSNQIQMIYTPLYGFKYSYLIPMIILFQ